MAKPRTPKKPTGPKKLGEVTSTTATLSLLVGDSKTVAAWRGAGRGDDDSDCERARQALAKRDPAMIDVGNQLAVALSLAVGHGTARIYQLGDRVIVVEAIVGDVTDPAFVSWIASAPEKKSRSAAILATPSKKLTLVPIGEAGTAGCSVPVSPKVAIVIEPATASAWGSGRRLFITPA